jgi:insulysin
MHDPPGMAGVAHFLEHMLFLGSEKYKGEDDFGDFLQTHSGGSNAFTAMEHTNYHFHANRNGFETALDIFAGFFTAPLLTQVNAHVCCIFLFFCDCCCASHK